jgi:hypothetical protein
MTLKLFTFLILLLVLGDSISTYLCLTQVPGGQEVNPLVIPVINWLGIGPAMWLSGLARTAGALWLYQMADTGELRKSIILIGFTFAIAMTLAANVNNWTILINNLT